MLSFILWYVLITLLGLLAFPLAYKLLPGLADRGYTLARALGWLVWGYLFWILGSLGLLQNDVGSLLLTMILLAALGFWAWRSAEHGEIRKWLRRQRRMILIVEVLFLAAFAGWTIVRAANPEITGTEKPMELAFINAILRSPSLPPNDPWLSGYSISYYHFGYILVAMLARLTDTPGGVAFNLGLALVFGLSAIGSYGLLYNLLAAWKNKQPTADGKPRSATSHRPSVFSALLGPFFVLIVSNLSGLLHVLRVNGVFWRQSETGEWVSPFWAWLDIGRFSEPPPTEKFPFWWWWQGSRIVQDYDFLGNNKGDIIDEFPFFSFLLGDLHPHVLTIPFAFLALALALNLLLGGSSGKIKWLGIPLQLNWLAFGFAALALGAMGFLNTWDWPFYVALFAGAYVILRLRERREEDPDWRPAFLPVAGDFFGIGLALGVTGGLLYLPFYLGFSSQAGGLIPNLIYITKGVYTWIQFAPLWVPIFGLVFYLWRRNGSRKQLVAGVKVTLILLAVLLAVTLLLVFVISIIHMLQERFPDAAIAASAYLGTLQAPGWRELISEGFYRRLTIPGTLLTLVTLLVFVIALLWPRRGDDAEGSPVALTESHLFVLLMTLLGALLVLVPEFFFLRDFFGYRINTIFKFYYLAWLLWSLAAAYGTLVLWERLSGAWGLLFKGGMLVVLSLALLYPLMGVWSKTSGFAPDQWELDGTGHITRFTPDEAAAMQWLWEAPLGVIAESVGGSYSGHARFSTHSGQPTVLGWIGHEHQWRGGFDEMGSRESDIQRLYCAPNWPETQAIIEQYNIRYIVLGGLERSTYIAGTNNCPSGVNEPKFVRYLEPVFEQGSVVIYAVP
jgi:YYY domain-containing protein